MNRFKRSKQVKVLFQETRQKKLLFHTLSCPFPHLLSQLLVLNQLNSPRCRFFHGRDHNSVTSRQPKDLPAFINAAVSLFSGAPRIRAVSSAAGAPG
jgi:hypothetical protein